VSAGREATRWMIASEHPLAASEGGRGCSQPGRRSRKRVRLQAHRICEVQVLVGVFWHSVTDGNCVAARRGGEQPEVNDQPVTQVNPIRPTAVASPPS
jgi:hypothetical protein